MAEAARVGRAERAAAVAPAAHPNKRDRRLPWRPWLRALHRDVGYLLVGLTIVYALSGLAVNHIDDWNSNFSEYQRSHELGPLPPGEEEATAALLSRLDIDEAPSESILLDDDELEVVVGERTFVASIASGTVHERGREARFFLRAANWLHLNRGKKAWTYIADGYAALLLFLALSGVFMLPGRKGLVGRGAILVMLGSAVPILYVVLSGGP
jgi:hypothetical protein